MGLTKIPVLVYMIVSQVGMLAGTIVYVNAGEKLASLTSTAGLLSPQIWLAFGLLAILPIISKSIISMIKTHRVYKEFKKPSSFDANLVVIGAGSGGLISAYIAATIKATVYLIEKNEMGGDCLNRGCVPSKAIISASKYATMYHDAETLGIKYLKPSVSFSAVMKGVHRAIDNVAPHDSVERYEQLGVRCVKGTAKILSPWEVQVEDRIIKTKSIIIATGGSPTIPDIPGLDTTKVLTSENIWNLTSAPKSLLVIGGGPIGCEISLAFARLGVKVTLIQRNTYLLPREEQEASELAQTSLEDAGVTVYTETVPIEVIKEKRKTVLIAKNSNEQIITIPFSNILSATGRKANVAKLTGNNISIHTNDNGTIATDAYLKTNIPNIFAVGDVVGPYQFTHVSAHMAWYASVNALFKKIKFAVDYKIIPAVTFLTPEIGRVGITEQEAKNQGLEYEISYYPMHESDRAIAESKTAGFIKVITEGKSDKILGATVASERGGEILGEFILAMKHNLGLNKILGTIHPYPTYIEAVKGVAGVWKRKHKPEKALVILENLFARQLKRK